MKHVAWFIPVAWIPGILLVPLSAFGADVALSPSQLPTWNAPSAYSVDVVMTAQDQTFSMKRYIDNGRIRSEVNTGGQTMILIEPGGSKHVMYSLVPSQKMAIKEAVPEGVIPDSAAAHPEVIYLGKAVIDGIQTKHYRILDPKEPVDAWFNAKTSAPVRMASGPDSARTTIEWKNLVVGPQPGMLFVIPPGFRTVDMDSMLAAAQGALGAPGTVVGGVVGLPDETALGEDIGDRFSGRLGRTATPYLDGQVGSWVGAKGYDR